MYENPPIRAFELYDKDCISFVKRFRSVKTFLTAFRNNYDFITAYHGTNINSAEAQFIRTQGLKPTSIELLKKCATDRFILPSDDQVLKTGIINHITEQLVPEEFITIGKIYFTLEKEPLQDKAYQYLLFGPESLLPVADHLRKSLGKNFRERMTNHGTPTIVKASLPVAKISDYYLEAIYGYWKNDGLECCIVYFEDVPGEYILALEQVPKPVDHYGFLWI